MHTSGADGADTEDAMPIRPFLAGRAFEPELIDQMSTALVKACDALRLQVVDDAATRLVARTIIELAERGVRDAETLLTMTLQEFGPGDASRSPEES
jgi:hypothetical protein